MEQKPPTLWKPVQLPTIACLPTSVQNLMHTHSARDSVAIGLHRDPEEQFSLSSGF